MILYYINLRHNHEHFRREISTERTLLVNHYATTRTQADPLKTEVDTYLIQVNEVFRLPLLRCVARNGHV